MTTQEIEAVKSTLSELGIQVARPMKIFMENSGASFIAHNPLGHIRLKHIALDLHIVRKCTEKGDLVVKHITGSRQWADILTKALPTTTFNRLQPNLVGTVPQD